MASNPIVVKDEFKPFRTTRHTFHEETASQIIGPRGIVHSDAHKNQKSNHSRSASVSIDNRANSRLLKGISNKIVSAEEIENFMQPNMRFKFRTDLERVYETLNNRIFGQVSKKPVDKQLRDLNLIVPKSKKIEPKDEASVDEKEESEEELIERLQYVDELNAEMPVVKKKKKNAFLANEKKKAKRKFVDNSGAKIFFKELHNKTFFKGASTFLIESKKDGKEVKKVKLPEVFTQNAEKMKNLTKQPDKDNLTEYFRKIPLNSTNYDIIKGNSLLYNVNFNPLRKTDDEQYDQDRFEKLKKLAVTYKLRTTIDLEGFQDNATIKDTKFVKCITLQDSFRNDSLILSDPFVFFSSFKANEMMEGRKEKDIERIIIDGKVYPKYEIKTITKTVLNKCNYLKRRNKAKSLN